MKKLIFVIIVVAFASCTTKKKITHIETSDSIFTGRDSVEYVYKEVLRDTTIYLSADSAYIEALLECDSLGEVYIKEIIDLRTGERVTPDVRIVDNVIYLGCTTEDSVAISVYWKNIYERMYNERISSTEVSTTVEDEKVVVRTPWFIRLWWVWAILAVAVFFVLKWKKML